MSHVGSDAHAQQPWQKLICRLMENQRVANRFTAQGEQCDADRPQY